MFIKDCWSKKEGKKARWKVRRGEEERDGGVGITGVVLMRAEKRLHRLVSGELEREKERPVDG